MRLDKEYNGASYCLNVLVLLRDPLEHVVEMALFALRKDLRPHAQDFARANRVLRATLIRVRDARSTDAQRQELNEIEARLRFVR